ncbi:MAG: glycosyltransferase, partial [Bryobacteraceae bacterium]
MRILWVKAGKLLPMDTGGKIRSYNILKKLALSHDVTLLSYYGGDRDSEYEEAIVQEFPAAKTIFTAAPESTLAQSVDYLRRLFQSAPFAVSKFTHRRVQRSLSELLESGAVDVAVCDFLSASQNFPEVVPTPTVLFQHNVETALWRRMASTESNPIKRIAYKIEAAKMERQERSALHRFRYIVAVSEHDRELMLKMNPNCTISVVPTGVDTQKYAVAPPAQAKPPRIVFTGSMDWEPNIDAVGYFCEQILPPVLSEFPELHGVEQELVNRCESDALAQRFRELMQTYQARAHEHFACLQRLDPTVQPVHELAVASGAVQPAEQERLVQVHDAGPGLGQQ